MRLLRVVGADRMRAIEAACFVEALPAIALMENAGRAVAARAMVHAPKRVCVVVGKGNNGADGLVAARALQTAGVEVSVCFAEQPSSELGRLHQRLLGAAPGSELDLASADVVIDALLGIGARQPLSKELARWVKLINERARRVIAVDVPSGVCAGFDEHSLAVQAHETVTFHAMKAELTMLPARAFAGDVSVADIGIPEFLFQDSDGFMITHDFARKHFARGGSSAHKGTFGHVAVIGGARGTEGAQVLAATAAARTGAGLVTTIGDGRRLPPEIMHASITADRSRYSAFCIGPGLGRSHDDALLGWLAEMHAPAVLDADALNALADRKDWWKLLGPGPRILTPHPLEFTRLFGGDVPSVQADRIAQCTRAAKTCGATVVLKGAGTVIATPDGRFGVCASGGRELAKGGTGDVLAGMIAALIGARPYALNTFVCASLGAYLHGSAGAHAAVQKGKTSVMATDVIEAIATAVRALA